MHLCMCVTFAKFCILKKTVTVYVYKYIELIISKCNNNNKHSEQ